MKLNLSILFITAASLIGCKSANNSDQRRHQAIDSVENYISKKENDPDSYQDLGYGKLKPIDDNPGTDTTSRKYAIIGYYITHSYRTKNTQGALEKYDQKFILNRDFSISEVRDLPDN